MLKHAVIVGFVIVILLCFRENILTIEKNA